MKYLPCLLGLLVLGGCATDASKDYKNYIVIASTSSPRQQCQVISKDAQYAAIFSRVHGPQTKENCEKWIADNCPRKSGTLGAP